MKNLFASILDRLHAGERVMLCSILESDGSSPRGSDAKMAVFSDGSTVGTVGGGALERLAGLHALELLREGRCEVKPYCLKPNKQEDIGMVCGGDVLLGFYCFCPDCESDLHALETLLDILGKNGAAWLETEYFVCGKARLRLIEQEDLHAEGARLPKTPTLIKTAEAVTLLEPVARHETVYVFGGGHVGAALVPALAAVGFAVTVYDARPGFAAASRFPEAMKTVCAPFEAALEHVQIEPEDYVVVMTPGHKADYLVLSQVLQTRATYIGCIGSKKKVAYVNGQLRQAGYSDADIARIHSPIGLPICAQTPEEIAVSITAELILHRHTAAQEHLTETGETT